MAKQVPAMNGQGSQQSSSCIHQGARIKNCIDAKKTNKSR